MEHSHPFIGVGKTVDADEALSQIRDSSVVAISGFNMSMTPELLIERLYKLYLKTGHPRDLFIVSDTFPGSPGRGLDLVAEDMYMRGERDFIRGMLLPYYGWSVSLQRMVLEDWFEAYTWSIGVMAYWFREVGSGRPGVLTRVGLGTFLDPRQDGGALNEKARRARTARVRLLVIDGQEYLLYEAPKPEVALIRASTSDEKGNLSVEDEGIIGTILNIAQAVKARPRSGIVIAQVLRIARYGSLRPKSVVVPGPMVDYVVVAPRDKHWQSATIDMDRRISGDIIPPLHRSMIQPVVRDIRKVIARRVLLYLLEDAAEKGGTLIVNLGVGIPSLVASIAVEEDVADLMEVTVESGPWGGIPLVGPDFGVAIGPYAILSIPDQFTVYEGGIVDVASLGFLQVDKDGNVNPSLLPNRLPGPGGFSVIAAGAPRIYFAGAFTAGKRDIRVTDDGLDIVKDGDIVKFVDRVYKIVYSPKAIREYQEQEVYYVTERAVFKLAGDGLELVEVAPGVDLDRDILSRMEFEPRISRRLETMDKRLFKCGRMGIASEARALLRR